MANRFAKDYIVSERCRKSVLGTHVDTFMSVVADLGYSPWTMRIQQQLLKNLIKWVRENDIVISNIDESITDRFLLDQVARERFAGVTTRPYIVFLIIFGEKRP